MVIVKSDKAMIFHFQSLSRLMLCPTPPSNPLLLRQVQYVRVFHQLLVFCFNSLYSVLKSNACALSNLLIALLLNHTEQNLFTRTDCKVEHVFIH